MSVALLSARTGIADGIYDEPPAEELGREGQITVNATSWTDWHDIDLKTDSVSAPVPIPMTLTGESDGKNGQYLYWFDVFGEGVSKNEFRSFTPATRSPSRPNGALLFTATMCAPTVGLCSKRPTPASISCPNRAKLLPTCRSPRTFGPRTKYGTHRHKCFKASYPLRASRSTAYFHRGSPCAFSDAAAVCP